MPPTSRYDLIDRLVGGDLATKLDTWYADGLSYQGIRDRLRDEYDVEVSSDSVRRWHLNLTEAAS